MGVPTNKRSSMTFFSDGQSHYSHRVRIVLAEKGVSVDIIDVGANDKPAELADLNPYNSLPTLVDRDLVLFETKVMMEYLDERFPHPPLLPVYPVARAQSRQIMYRIERDWCPLVDKVLSGGKDAAAARKELRDSLAGIAPMFNDLPYFFNEEFSLVDCCMAPLLWRLDQFEISLPKTKQVKPLLDYMDRLFARDAFQQSLTEYEREMR
ncbi:glutathione S-transferase N-terminal domain-containing protein [uncultured Microbulbifer sp.]|uniref:glutathione S-transferase N-terminal domain-containing protein n=1 Tax=uncultured Microbulbifer sp. TaxID=348147 RepID=UPI00263863A3|nr:glutathione S-transferase N-terminal domain-containing protein [uncultured Microbulbifer sp.]